MPSSTTKWLKFQWMMQGIGNSCSVEGSLRNPLASKPKVRAARTMLLALLPSRETPQATRSCSSGIQAPWWASTMASAAAPHSTASICRMVGVCLTFLRQNSLRNRCHSDGGRAGGGICGDGALSIKAGQALEEGDHEIDRALPARGDFRARQRSTGETNRRAFANRPAIAADAVAIMFEADGGGVGGAFLGKAGHQIVVVEHRRHALGRHREIRDRHDGADHRSELLALDRARLDADRHPEFYILAALGRNEDQRLELGAFAFDRDHRRADGQYGAGGDLDFENASFDRADDLGVLGQ